MMELAGRGVDSLIERQRAILSSLLQHRTN